MVKKRKKTGRKRSQYKQQTADVKKLQKKLKEMGASLQSVSQSLSMIPYRYRD